MDNISEIPKGFYCYDENGQCPYWSINQEREEQNNGYCFYLNKGDWDFSFGLLWDQVKSCSINEYNSSELERMVNLEFHDDE